MGKSDIAIKKWLGNKERFADLFNGVVFQGNQIIRPEELEAIPGESDIIIEDKERKMKGVQRYRDIVMRWKKEAALVILACENQSAVNYAMPVRTMLYDSLSYADQMKQLWRGHENASEKVSGEEFLSQFCKGHKIIPVLSLIFYYGLSEWDGSRNLYEMFRWNQGDSSHAFMQKYISNYHINLIDVGNLAEVNQFQTDLQVILGMLKYRGEKEELWKYIRENRMYFSNVDFDDYQAITELLHSEQQLKKVKAEDNGKEKKVDMCKALEDIYKDGVIEGREEGIRIFVQDNLAEGISEERILEKLKWRFSVSAEMAEMYYRKFSTAG